MRKQKSIPIAYALYAHTLTKVSCVWYNKVTDRSRMKTFLSQLFDYAVMQDIISKDHDKTEFLNIGEKEQSTNHYKFTNTEIEALLKWSHSNDYVQMILMMIYSGARPGEFLAVKKEDVNSVHPH